MSRPEKCLQKKRSQIYPVIIYHVSCVIWFYRSIWAESGRLANWPKNMVFPWLRFIRWVSAGKREIVVPLWVPLILCRTCERHSEKRMDRRGMFWKFPAAKERIDEIIILYNSLRPPARCDWLTPLEEEHRTGKLKHHWSRKAVVRKAYVNSYQDNIFWTQMLIFNLSIVVNLFQGGTYQPFLSGFPFPWMQMQDSSRFIFLVNRDISVR